MSVSAPRQRKKFTVPLCCYHPRFICKKRPKNETVHVFVRIKQKHMSKIKIFEGQQEASYFACVLVEFSISVSFYRDHPPSPSSPRFIFFLNKKDPVNLFHILRSKTWPRSSSSFRFDTEKKKKATVSLRFTFHLAKFKYVLQLNRKPDGKKADYSVNSRLLTRRL